MNKNVLNKLYSSTGNVELSEVKVDLALVDDVKNIYESANKLYKKNADSLYKISKQLENDFQKSADEFQKALNKYNELEKISNELGISLPNEITKLKSLIEYGIKDSIKSKSNAVNVLAI